MLSILGSLAKSKKEEYKPDKGRNKSRERQSRIDMVNTLSELARKNGVYTGSGNTGLFPDFVREVYDTLGITRFNLSNDIREALKTPAK